LTRKMMCRQTRLDGKPAVAFRFGVFIMLTFAQFLAIVPLVLGVIILPVFVCLLRMDRRS
jgi:hypothetical protein